ncbi:MAG: ribonuclease HIII [Kiritimatiellaeota bacterium]|nr:ribonuclease HIII [Kiritimatiellota bacterium]
MAIKKNSYTFVLSKEQQETLKTLLSMGNYKRKVVPHTIIAVEAEECVVNLYTSGKCLVQGSGAEDFVLFFLEPTVLQSATVGYEDILNPERVSPHMGIDESGKGDFFGPLVAAAAYVDPDLAQAMQELGVKDCKQMTDKAVFFVGGKLRQLLTPKRYTLVSIGPESYNRLYFKMRNVNAILAWAHARCIENVLDTMPGCPRAVADQFGAKQVIERALMKKGRKVTLEQRHKAESDIAVAAASVLAREAFLRSLAKLSETYGVALPKGASDQVKIAAIDLVAKSGPEYLMKVAKCHFRTADQVLVSCGYTRRALGPDGQIVSRQEND